MLTIGNPTNPFVSSEKDFGGTGENVLIGGEGEDTFIFDRAGILDSDGVDTIADFAPEADSLPIQGLSTGDRLDYDANSGILSLNGNDFADLDFESDDAAVVSLNNSDFSLNRGLTLSEAVAAEIENFRNGGSLLGSAVDDNRQDTVENNSDLTQTQFEVPFEDDDFGLL